NEVGKAITVIASFTDGDGTVESMLSAPTQLVIQPNQPPSGTVQIQGDFGVGELLQAVPNFTDPDGIDSDLDYQWFCGGAEIPGADSQSYELTAADIGESLRVRVRYTDQLGKLETIHSQFVLVEVDNAAPTGLPLIEGDLVEGQPLTGDTSTIADADGLGVFSYQWLRDGVEIIGATTSTYTLGTPDVGSAISLRVSYTDGGGTAEQLISAETALVVALADTNNPPTGLVAALGIGEPGQTLEINADSVADQDGLGSFSYQWFVDGEAVPGATADSFLLTEA